METEQEIYNAARAIISFTDSYAYKKERKQNELQESESADSLTKVNSSIKFLRDKVKNNNDFKQMIKNQNILRSINQLTIFKLGNHSNQKVDRLRLNVRYNSRQYLSWIQEYGDAQDFADLVNVGYGKVICISFSTAGGINEEKDEEILNELFHIFNFLRALHERRNWQPSFQPLPLLARRTEEQIEEEGANEEIEAQMSNYRKVQGYYSDVKQQANKAKAEILNHFIHRRRI